MIIHKQTDAILICVFSAQCIQIAVHRDSPRGTSSKGLNSLSLSLISCFCILLDIVSQVYFDSDEVHACLVTCGGLYMPWFKHCLSIILAA